MAVVSSCRARPEKAAPSRRSCLARCQRKPRQGAPGRSRSTTMAGEAILIVDDNAQNLKLARVVLAFEGYEVRTAVDAEDALRVLESFRPRLILMDLQLPGMDGLQLTRHLKASPAHRGITIIALTAYAMKGDDERV